MRKTKYRWKGIDEYFDEVEMNFYDEVVNHCFDYPETLPCQLVRPSCLNQFRDL
jgi:hypothetical protein